MMSCSLERKKEKWMGKVDVFFFPLILIPLMKSNLVPRNCGFLEPLRRRRKFTDLIGVHVTSPQMTARRLLSGPEPVLSYFRGVCISA